MISVAIFIGCLSYLLLLIGFAGLFYKPVLLLFTLFSCALYLYLYSKRKKLPFTHLKSVLFKFPKKKIDITFLILILTQLCINFFGALAPELSFDALWYHLTLPKLYVLSHQIIHISGGLLYYSDMPKLLEILYVLPLSFTNEIGAKIIHFAFGIGILLTVYKITGKYTSTTGAILAIAILSANLVFSWESTTAYIDLGRTFFEITALMSFLRWVETNKRKWLFYTGVLLGFAITTKVLAIVSLLVFLIVVLLIAHSKKYNLRSCIGVVLTILTPALLIPSPWYIFSFIHTGNPVYPFFTSTYAIKPVSTGITPISFLKDLWMMILFSSDPISPIYLIIAPLTIFIYKKFPFPLKIITLYVCLSLFFWFLTPRTGGGRFLLPYLPACSIIAATTSIVYKKTKFFWFLLLSLITFVSLSSICYRAVASRKYLAVVIGQESKQNFLTHNLNFEFGDFYDTDAYFATHIQAKDRVLLYGFHNLYYVDFPFIHESWVKRGDTFNYIATQKTTLPSKFTGWKLIYTNPATQVKLYTKDYKVWTY
jgi:hypothetical protein